MSTPSQSPPSTTASPNEQWTMVENLCVTLRESLDPESTPKELMQQILDVEQMASGIIDSAKDTGSASTQDKGGPM